MEFWQEIDFRLHHRQLFERNISNVWRETLLYP
jgi:pyridoxine/pyridoxamine 5'-phosphate oxidase